MRTSCYLHGNGVFFCNNVGCGKTFLMNLFHDMVEIPPEKKKKFHFHGFMLEVHRRLFKLKEHTSNVESSQNIMDIVQEELMDGASLLCFDEFQVFYFVKLTSFWKRIIVSLKR